jgi:hypothetical protein
MSERFSRVCLGLFCCLCIVGCEDQPAAPPAADNAAEPTTLVERIDRHGDEAMAGTAKAEAREWLKSDNHVLFKGDRKELAKLVEDFYAAGAKQIYIIDIESHEGHDYGGALLVLLPTDAATRGRLFEIGKRAEAMYQEDPVSDKGQKYLYYGFD